MAEYVKDLRIDARLSQGQLAAKLNDMGLIAVDQSTVSRWESGRLELSYEAGLWLDAAFGLCPGAIGASGGYTVPEEVGRLNVEKIIRSDPELDPDVRTVAARLYRGYLRASRRLNG